jgi:hypothetical protein
MQPTAQALGSLSYDKVSPGGAKENALGYGLPPLIPRRSGRPPQKIFTAPV